MKTKSKKSLAFSITKMAFAVASPIVDPGTRAALAGATAIADIVEKLTNKDEDPISLRKIQRSVEDIVDIAEQRLNEAEPGLQRRIQTTRGALQGIGAKTDREPVELEMAADVVRSVLESANLDYVEIAAEQFSPRTIVKQVRSRCLTRWHEEALGSLAIEYGEAVLYISAQILSAYMATVPFDDRDISLRTLLLATDMPKRFAESLRREMLPEYRSGTPEELADFEAAYRSAIARKFGNIEQFGLSDLPDVLRNLPVDLSFISLRAIATESTHYPMTSYEAEGVDSHAEAVEQVIAHAVSEAMNDGRGARIALRGGAGSGKTTVVHWLATKCAQSISRHARMPNVLASLNEAMPFVVPLRAAFRSDNPGQSSDEALIQSVSSRVSRPPGNWIKNVLASLRSVVILDGLDEVPRSRRSDLYDWIEGLQERFPKVTIVLTSRPNELRKDWLVDNAYLQVDLLGLTIPQIRRCIDRWFDALCSRPSRSTQNYRARQVRLVNEIESSPAVRDLAETPMLATMLCAYYANTGRTEVLTRSDLVAKVAAVLVHLREDERGGPSSDLKQSEKMSILGAVAFSMFEANVSTLPFTSRRQRSALDVVRQALAQIPGATADAVDALKFLSDRSFVLMRVGTNEVQFAHRLFLEYFAAYHAADLGLDRILFQMNALSGWNSVAVLFCSTAKAKQADDFILELLELTKKGSVDSRRTATFTVAECLGSQPRHSDEVTARALSAISSVLPPKSQSEIVQLTYAGDAVLKLFSRATSPAEAKIFVRAAARIRGQSALEILSALATSDFSRAIAGDLLDAWPSFPIVPYVEQVLNLLDLTREIVAIRTAECLAAVGRLQRVKHLKVFDLGDSVRDLAGLAAGTEVQILDLSDSVGLRSISGVEALSSLERVALPDSGWIDSINSLAQCSKLRAVFGGDGSRITDLSALGGIASLTTVWIHKLTASAVASLHSGFQSLRSLSLRESEEVDLRNLGAKENLSWIDANVSVGVRDARLVSTLRSLRVLSLRLSPNHVAFSLPASLRELTLCGWVREIDLLGQAGPLHAVTKLILPDGVSDWTDLRALVNFPSLEELYVGSGSNVRSLLGLKYTPRLRSLVVRRSGLKELTGTSDSDTSVESEHWTISALSQLQEVDFTGSSALGSVAVLTSLRELKVVRLLGGVPATDVDSLIFSRPDVRVVWDDPFWDQDFESQ